jgi:hypothetical protein
MSWTLEILFKTGFTVPLLKLFLLLDFHKVLPIFNILRVKASRRASVHASSGPTKPQREEWGLVPQMGQQGQ